MFDLPKYGDGVCLARLAALLEALDVDRARLQRVSVVVTGSNGKGSTAAMCAHVGRGFGLRTGLFTSPHLVRFNERIQVDGVEIDDEAFAARQQQIERAIADVSKHLGQEFSAFEALFPGSPDPSAASCASCGEFLVGSDYVRRIEARAPAAGVTYTNISTRYDELVSPYTSSFLTGPNVTNITLQDHCALDFSDHLSIISSPITGQYVLNALDPAHAQRPPCVPVAPAA